MSELDSNSPSSQPKAGAPSRPARTRRFAAIALLAATLAGGGALTARVTSHAALAASTALTPLADVANPAPSSAIPVGASLAPIVQRVLPAVVNISVVLNPETGSGENQNDDGDDAGPTRRPGFPKGPLDDLLRRFFEQQQGMGNGPDSDGPGFHRNADNAKQMALGSGFIIDPAGFIVTNNHVVGNARSVTVTFQDDSKHMAKVIGRDPKTDLALIKIDAPKPLPFVAFADSDAVRVGDWVIAIGNPFGLGGTVTTGIVSARSRDIHEGPFDDFFQLDASINRGNSGGPTFDLAGNVIGINTAIYSPNGGSVGIGFAIPANLAKHVVAQLKATGQVERGWLGVQIQDITPEIAGGLGLDAETATGALVADVQPNSPASKAGLHAGDVITRFNGRLVAHTHDLPRMVAEVPAGQSVDVQLLRNGRSETLPVVIAQLASDTAKPAPKVVGDASDSAAPAVSNRALGLHLSAIDPQSRRQLHLPKQIDGVLVTTIDRDSPAAKAGLEPGDVIQQINQQPVTGPADAAGKLRQAAESKRVLLLLNRHGTPAFVGLGAEQLS